MKSYTMYFIELAVCINQMQSASESNGTLQLDDFTPDQKKKKSKKTTKAIAWYQEGAQ